MNLPKMIGSIDIDEILPYKPTDEKQNAESSRGSADTAHQSLACWLEASERQSHGTDISQRIAEEAKSVREWAASTGRLIDQDGFSSLAQDCEHLAGESEHDLFHVEGTGRVVKATIPPNFGAQGAAMAYLINLANSNAMFGDEIVFHGVLEESEGLAFVISQPYIHGVRPDRQDIATWFISQGYTEVGHNRWYHDAAGHDIADTHEGNLIKTQAGDLVPIDVQVLSGPTRTLSGSSC